MSVVVGLLAGVIIGKSTEYYTSQSYKPTQKVSESSQTGPATVIISGLGLGMLSTAIPVVTVGVQRKIRSFIRLRKFFHNPVAQFCYRCLPPFIGNALGYGWAKKSRLKELANPYPYKGEEKEELVLYAKEMEQKEHHDYYVFGHRHIDLDLQITRDSRVILLGDCDNS